MTTQKNIIYLKRRLAEFLECDVDDIETSYDDSTFELGNKEYLLLTDSEAYVRARDNIKDSIWAFSSWFLASHSGLDEEIIKHLQEKCEGANDVLLKSIKDIEFFVADAIACDGRGHFLSSYDGNEQQINDNLFLYRTN